jgi:hypothetical protein
MTLLASVMTRATGSGGTSGRAAVQRILPRIMPFVVEAAGKGRAGGRSAGPGESVSPYPVKPVKQSVRAINSRFMSATPVPRSDIVPGRGGSDKPDPPGEDAG